GYGLPGRRLGLLKTVLKLSNLVIDFRGGDLREELPGLDVIADVDIALQHIAAGARVDVCLLESERCARKRHVEPAVSLRDLLDPHARREGCLPLGRRGDVAALLKMPPCAKSERRDHNRQHGQPEQVASGTAARPGTIGRFRDFGPLRRCRRSPWLYLRCRQKIGVIHSGISAKTPWASLPSLRLRKRA